MNTNALRRRMFSQNVKRTGQQKRSGQALIEFALAGAFLFLLLGAAVDAGLAYRSYQTLINATANASSYLSQFPFDHKTGETLNTIASANDKALKAFREEQGSGNVTTVGGSTFDLNSNGIDDATDFASTYTSDWYPSGNVWFRIDEASSGDVYTDPTNGYGVKDSFNGTSDNNCKANESSATKKGRERFDTTVGAKNPCYIVVRTQMIYRPFFLSPVFGKQVTIRAISIKPIVGNPIH